MWPAITDAGEVARWMLLSRRQVPRERRQRELKAMAEFEAARGVTICPRPTEVPDLHLDRRTWRYTR